MVVEVQVTITGSRAAVWAAVTNVEGAADFIRGIDKIEILDKPPTGFVGLKWRETRMLFGKPASADKTVTAAVENEFFTTRAEDNGFVFLATTRLSDAGGCVTLTSTHDSRPQGFVARLTALPMVFFKGVMRRALVQDLTDIKAAVERAAAHEPGGH